MKWISLAIGLTILGYIANTYFVKPAAVAVQAASEPMPEPPKPPQVEEAPPPVLDERAMEKIRLSTKDSTPMVRWEAVNLLVASGHPEADDFLLEILQRDTEPDLRLKAVDALRSRPGPKVTAGIMRGLKDSEADVRLAVLGVLVQREDTDSSRAVAELVGDSDERVRLAAIQALNTLNERREAKKREAAERHKQAQAEYEEKARQYIESQKKIKRGP
ncbi:MAG: hypothetical protein FD126_2395 [Elusimicrobia bacterium]|nr:MAG: hypothetical protein FD126_2395 [Elusimicrobiota bacterium]